MCEPMHSINQFPDDPDVTPKIEATLESDKSKGSKIVEWIRKIGGWFHFSMMGKGHSESMSARNVTLYRLPEPTRYEAAWWDRSFNRDGQFLFNGLDEWKIPQKDATEYLKQKDDAFESARIYAERVSIGSLQSVRRFLETSIMKSDRYGDYVDRFIHGMLNMKGQIEFEQKLRRVFNTSIFENLEADPLCKIVLGFTRKRKLLIPEWADDNKLWLPSGV